MKVDPVCGMKVDEQKASPKSTYQGEQYAFCGPECKEEFDKHPERYAHAPADAGAGAKQPGR